MAYQYAAQKPMSAWKMVFAISLLKYKSLVATTPAPVPIRPSKTQRARNNAGAELLEKTNLLTEISAPAQFSSQDIVYNSTSNEWACCYNNLGETVDCAQSHLTATFEATPEPSLTIEGKAPGTPLPVPPPRSSSSSTPSTSITTFPSSSYSSSADGTPTSSTASASSVANGSSTADSSSIANASPTADGSFTTDASSTINSSSRADSFQHSPLDTAPIASISEIGALFVISLTFLFIFLCLRRSKRRQAFNLVDQIQAVIPPNDYQRYLLAKGAPDPNSPNFSNYPDGNPYNPRNPYNINTNLNYANQNVPPYPLQTYVSPNHRTASELGVKSYYGDETGSASKKVTQQSPISELGGDEWQTELDGRRKRSTSSKSPSKADSWRDKKLPTPREEKDLEKDAERS